MVAPQHHGGGEGGFQNEIPGPNPRATESGLYKLLVTPVAKDQHTSTRVIKRVGENSITQLTEGILGALVSLEFLLFQSIQETELIILACP